MKKSYLFFVILSFLVFSLVGVSHGWQGRMAGMGNPFGLVEDESDLLIHPSSIADGKGIIYYGRYHFNYRDVSDWNYTINRFNLATGSFFAQEPFRTSGDEQEHYGLLGATLPLDLGRLGLFFQYVGERGQFNGRENEFWGNSYFNRYSFESDFDAYSLMLIYGLPLDGLKLGGEIELSYHCEEYETFFNEDRFGSRLFLENLPIGTFFSWQNLFQFMVPYDSEYWKSVIKGSLEAGNGPTKATLTLKGGFIFASGNRYEYSSQTLTEFVEMDGDVKGWTVGGDLWLRYTLGNGLSLPLVAKADYEKIKRDGSGTGNGVMTIGGFFFDYKNREEALQIEIGGGLDKEFKKGTRIATGLYYSYLLNKNDFLFVIDKDQFFDHYNYPERKEHRVTLRLAGEKEFSSSVSLRMGLSGFYSWVKKDLEFNSNVGIPTLEKISLNGSQWGFEASLGGTVKFQQLSIEPYLVGGYQELDLDGDGVRTGFKNPGFIESQEAEERLMIGGGFSIKF